MSLAKKWSDACSFGMTDRAVAFPPLRLVFGASPPMLAADTPWRIPIDLTVKRKLYLHRHRRLSTSEGLVVLFRYMRLYSRLVQLAFSTPITNVLSSSEFSQIFLEPNSPSISVTP
jgi:hypothetical protein